MQLTSLRRQTWAALALIPLLLVLGRPSLALVPEASQAETLKEMIEVLESRHYAKKRYDDALSASHLHAYIDNLDPQRMFFNAADVQRFSEWESQLDDLGRDGDLSPAFAIFNAYEQSLTARLEKILEDLPAMVAGFDFTREEYLPLGDEEIPWAETDAELDDRWRKRLKNQVLSLKLADKPMDEISETLERRYRNRLNRIAQYNAQDVFQVYANSLTELYDPHTSYFSPRRAENFDINMSLSFDGIGAVLQADDEFTKVVRLVPAGPAEKQGQLNPSDLIVGVGQGDDGELQDVIGWRLDEVVDLIRGPRGTTVRLEVMPGRGKTDARRIIAIQRNQVKLEEQAAKGELIEVDDPNGRARRIGVIDIPAFYIDFAALRRGDPNYKSTTRDVARIIEELEEQGAEGLVIDLRSNGGGSLQEANELTGLFIEYGPTVQIRSAQRRVWRDGKRRRSAFYDGPVAVVMNRLSASASEIFAGALQDYGRALIVGDRSFGKGTVQTLLDLPEGQLKVTESKFYRISGDSTQHRGVMPDITFPSLFDHEEIGESSLDNALSWDQISPVRHEEYDRFDSLLPTLARKHQERVISDPDYVYLLDQVEMAKKTRGMKQLPLSEAERRAMRDEQEALALNIENKRRVAKGLEPLDSLLDNSDDETSMAATDDVDIDADAAVDAADEASLNNAEDGEAVVANDEGQDEEDADILLVETGRILADALLLEPTQVASNPRKTANSGT
ncbi:MAG: carboxy terminal-processing peptidase [Halieaceae bacterium]|jgi:carboxyl-terminal processing protease|nr:carboxy terminal-processing peptidase [Halieaceae bacterium]